MNFILIFEGSNLSEATHLPHNSKNDSQESRNLGMVNIKKNVLAVSFKFCSLFKIFIITIYNNVCIILSAITTVIILED